MQFTSPPLLPQALIERGPALAWLQQRVALAARQRGQVVVVSGEAGIGKSSLLEALASGLSAPALVAWGRCDPLLAPRHLGPLQDMAPWLPPSLGAALAEGQAAVTLYPGVLHALSQLPPGSVLCFEDLHWADHATLDLLKYLVRRLAPLRVCLVLTHRSDELDPAHPLTTLLGELPAAHSGRLALEPLSPAAVALLAGQQGRAAGELHRVTGGNPFFLAEVLAEPAGPDGRLPASVRDAVLARVARLGAAERGLLRSLSVAPDPVPPLLIEQLQGAEGLAAAAALQQRGLLVAEAMPGAPLRFRHELLRRAVLDHLALDERRACQRRLLHACLALGDAVPPDVLVHHAAELGDAATLLAHAPRAAASAARLGAHHQAAAMLGAARPYLHAAPPELAAQLLEDWAYEASLAQPDDAVLQARRQAVERWRALNRPDRVGENLRWLWRLHWTRGETALAERAAAESLAVLEPLGASAELARAYALRAHVALLQARRADAAYWGQQAMTMAARFGDTATQVQSMVTVGTALLFSGQPEGGSRMEEALRLALAHGLHEEAARVYTNHSEYAIVTGDLALAERLVLQGLAFDAKHGLDAWLGYLSGRHAQLRLEQGRWEEAETLARAALAVEGRTVLMRLPASTVLARLQARRGTPQALTLLQEVLRTAQSMGEMQRIAPARLAAIEHHYLHDEQPLLHGQLRALVEQAGQLLRPWDAGALRLWLQRAGLPAVPGLGLQPTPAQALELGGDHEAAARQWARQGLPFEAALACLAGARAGKTALAAAAAEGFQQLGCVPGLQAVQRLAGAAPARRGPYRAARRHPLGLTAKEVQVLALMAEGASNAEIATRLSRSQRTVETHVSSILDKLSAANRLEAVLRVLAEPWLARA